MANNKQIGLLFGVDNTGLDKGSGKTIADQLKTISDEINKKGEYTQIKFSVDTQATTKQIQDQLNQIAKGLTIKIGGFDQSTIDANAKKQVDALTRQVNNASNKLAGMGGNADIRKYGNVAKIANEFKTYTTAVNEAKAAEAAMNANRNPQTQQAFIDAVNKARNAQQQLNAAFNNATAFGKQELVYNKVIARITEYQAKYKETLKNTPELAAKLEELNRQLAGGTFQGTETDANNRFVSLTNQIRKAGGEAETLWQKVKRIFGEKLGYGIIASAAMMARRALQQMYNNVVKIDTAMTELKKVTNETDESYKKFLDGSAERAQKLGATISDVVTATADFARLGYNLEDASTLSDVATVYKNVGDGISDINSASESIISTMKAFGYSASNAMDIVDKFNEVGNNYAISSKGVGDALLNSASAMATANNTLDETIALSTAANTIVQNPEKVGSQYNVPTIKTAISVNILRRTRPSKDFISILNTSIRKGVFLFKHKGSDYIPTKGQRTGYYIKCENCGKEVYQTQTQYNKAKHHFCSNTCQKIYQHNQVYEDRECEICGKVFNVAKRSSQRFCSIVCQGRWQSTQTGVLNPRNTQVKRQCEYCGKEFYVKKYKTENGQHNLCSTECRKNWYANTWSQSEEWKEKSKLRAIEILEKNPIIKNTKPQMLVDTVLNKLNIVYQREYNCKYFAIDNYLAEHNLMIEVMGDFWHANPLKYNKENLRDIQKKRIPRDKAKHTYIRNKYNIEILYLWENDIYNNIELCELLIKEYIKSNGNLKNYHSFNYIINDGEIVLNDEIIIPFQDR